ncbi:MAG: hypothetical protein JW720_02815 [Sedimentisphaerales bacterium]|nr:hypothetical protein [Sedimentisphaerales bacterium]
MEDNVKKPLMIGIIVVCLGVAAYLTFSGGGRKEGERKYVADENKMILMKCAVPSCGNVTEISEVEYSEFSKEHALEDSLPGMVCEKCGKPGVFKAMKCPYCGAVFLPGEAGSDEFEDMCPKCGKSKIEETRKESAG